MPPGWYPDPEGRPEGRYWNGHAWAPAAHAGAPPVGDDDPWLSHFLRFVGVFVVYNVAGLFLIGHLWLLFVLDRVGYRKRDFLLMMIPVYNVMLLVGAFWRYTARRPYWPPRPDRLSRPLAPRPLLLLTVSGWLLGVVFAAGVVIAVTMSKDMSETDFRADFVDFWTRAGAERPVAECAADRVSPGIPYDSEEELAGAIQAAFAACGSEVPQ